MAHQSIVSPKLTHYLRLLFSAGDMRGNVNSVIIDILFCRPIYLFIFVFFILALRTGGVRRLSVPYAGYVNGSA